MPKAIWVSLFTFIIFSLSSCSSVKEGSSSSDNTNTSATVFSLSGSIAVTPLIHIDSDVNDPGSAVFIDNGTISQAQIISNFSTVNGFATKQATGRVSNFDRFASISDVDDVYQLNLQKDQPIRLQVVDFSSGGDFQGDLDLFLFDSGSNLVGQSITTDEFESITVPADGFYYIHVQAFSGASKYVLTLDNISTARLPQHSSTVNFVPNQAIVKYKSTLRNKASSIGSVNILSAHLEDRATLTSFNYSAKSSDNPSAFDNELRDLNNASFNKLKTLTTIKNLSLRDDVEYAEPNYIRQALATPNDTLYSLQWHYPAINLPSAWDITDGSRAQDVIVAVIDTGVFLGHDDLINKLVAGYDFIADPISARDGDGIDSNPDDPGDSSLQNQSSWHGTHVAGTIAAETNNNNGIAGVSWEAKIMPLRVLGEGGGTSYDTVQAVLFASQISNDSGTIPPQIADIINLSLGGSGSSTAEQDAFTAARNKGVIIVAAAGNENTNQLSFPASYAGVISVSATGLDNTLAPYSNFGTEIDIAAPGGNQAVDLDNDSNADGVLSSVVDDSTGTRNSSYSYYQGTSMATPHMAGVVALMRAVHPALTPDELDILISSGAITTDLGPVGRDNSFGHGLIDALKAVQQAQKLQNGGVLPPQPAIITASPTQLALGANITSSSITIRNINTNIGDAVAEITSVTSNTSWLSVAENTVDANKLGIYDVTINKAGLADNASYLGTITFNISTGATLNVPVTIIKGSISTLGEVGTLYLLLIDTDGDVEEQVIPTNVGNGIYNYSFSNINAGNYTLLVGSDVDNDLFICQTGESCGAYPTLSQISEITLDRKKTNLNFSADIISLFSASSLSASQLQNNALGVQRLPAIKSIKSLKP